MKLIFTFVLIPFFLWFSGPEQVAQQYATLEWKLKKEKEGIKVFTRDIVGSNLKELKITMSFEKASFPKILSLLNNANAYKNWMFKCSDSKTVNKVNDKESINYYKFDFPWPLSDREAYMKSVVVEYTDKRLIVTTTPVTGFGAEQDDVVRIEKHYNRWEFQKNNSGRIDLTYYLKTNPGGSIPDWAVNMAIDKGPTSSLSNFRGLLQP